MPNTTVQITEKTHESLQELAARGGESVQDVLERAVEEYRRNRILDQANEAYASHQADPDAWREEMRERELWDAILADGLDTGDEQDGEAGGVK